MPTTTTIAKFKTAAQTGSIKAGTNGLSRATLERLVEAGIAKRVETVGAAWAGPNGTDAATHRPSTVRYTNA